VSTTALQRRHTRRRHSNTNGEAVSSSFASTTAKYLNISNNISVEKAVMLVEGMERDLKLNSGESFVTL
jgi:hypothetical protein